MNTNDQKVTPEEFIKAWQTSSSVAEVAEKTKLTAKKVYNRRNSYKKKGVPLKDFKRTAIKTNWAELAKLAKSLLPEPEKPKTK